jgi:hypothetical protein
MPTYMLSGAAQVGLTPRPLTVSIRLEGTTVGASLHAETRGQPLSGVVRPRQGILIIPHIDEVTTVRVAPVGAERFPAGTVAFADVAVSAPTGTEPERAVVIPIDLSGLTTRDVFVFQAGDNKVLVRAARVLPPPEDLGSLGNASRIAATEILGVQVVDELVAVNVVVAIDGSASFNGLLTDGSADAVIRVLAGIIAVMAPGMELGAAVVGSVATRVVLARVGELSGVLSDALAAHPQSLGLRSGTSGLLDFASTGNTVTFLVTDAVPADVVAFDAADAVEGEARHLVVLSSQSAWALQTSPRTPTTLVDLGEAGERDTSLSDALLSDPNRLRSLVRSLLIGCFPIGTSTFEKVAQ